MEKMWNLWHGCKKISAGCKNCYVYRMDSRYDRDAGIVSKTKAFDLPVRKRKNGEYSCPSGTFFWTCFTSDFLLKDCDFYRIDAWNMIKERQDCRFLFITKRIDRFRVNLPEDWNGGYENVTVCTTCENQETTDYRLVVFKELPIRHKIIVHEPLLSQINISAYLDESIEQVTVGGESGPEARVCRFEWILAIREQCIAKDISFTFRQTGAKFVKDGKLFSIPREKQHSQARKAGIDYKSSKCK